MWNFIICFETVFHIAILRLIPDPVTKIYSSNIFASVISATLIFSFFFELFKTITSISLWAHLIHDGLCVSLSNYKLLGLFKSLINQSI